MKVSKREQINADAVADMESAIWQAIKDHTPKEHLNDDQLGCAVVSIAMIIRGLAKIMGKESNGIYKIDCLLNNIAHIAKDEQNDD